MGVSKQLKNQQKYEIIGVIFFTLALLCLISLINPDVGLISSLVERLLSGATGQGRYLFPALLVFWGVRSFLIKGRKRVIPRFYGGFLLFAVVLTLLHMHIPRTEALNAGLKGEGGGLVGAICSLVLERSFGLTGTYVILITLALVGVLLSTDVSLSALGKKIAYSINIFLLKGKKYLFAFLFTEEEEEEENNKTEPEIATPPVIIDHSGIDIDDFPDDKTPQKRKSTVHNPGFHKEHVITIRPGESIDLNSSGKNECPVNLFPGEAESSATAEHLEYHLPPLNILTKPGRLRTMQANKDITENIHILEETLQSFGVKARVTQVSRGPTITRYEIQPPAGVKVSRIVGLADDIALCMAAPDVRIEAPIPGKAAVGIEVPNREVSMVPLRELLETEEFQKTTSCLTVALGKDIAGNPILADLAQMPHLLIAGATGSGKSICLNILIASILFKASPDKVKFMIIDPKMVDLSTYNGVPHLVSPVVTDSKKAATALRWAVKEMECRYELFANAGVRDIYRYNSLSENSGVRYGQGEGKGLMPFLVVIIDELSDLMMVAPAEVEDAICRLAQMARAAGIHLVVATQRPSVDVITGLIKANIPSRISFAVSSQIDSRTILDMPGAEKLLGRGDMLFYPVGAAKPVRLQGAYLSDREVESLVSFLTKQVSPYHKGRLAGEDAVKGGSYENGYEDELLPRAVEIFIESGHASLSLLQRRLRVGYSRAARLIDVMEKKGIIGAHEGTKPRTILMTLDQFQENFKKGNTLNGRPRGL